MSSQDFKVIQWFQEVLENGSINELDLEFDRTRIFFKQGDGVFTATTDKRGDDELATLDVSTLERTPIPREDIYPVCKEDFTLAPNPLPDGIYIKHPRLAHYVPEKGDAVATRFLNEVYLYEALKNAPHPNIAQYHGCIVEDGRITGIVLKHYPANLEDRLEAGPITNEEGWAISSAVDSAASHLHQLNYAHRDICKDNIMMDGETPILIDFEKATFEGCLACRGVMIEVEGGFQEDHNHSMAGILKDYQDIMDLKVALITAEVPHHME